MKKKDGSVIVHEENRVKRKEWYLAKGLLSPKIEQIEA